MSFKRTVSIREVDNGFVVNLSAPVDNKTLIPNGIMKVTSFKDQELCVTSIPKLLKLLKVFFWADIVEQEEEVVVPDASPNDLDIIIAEG